MLIPLVLAATGDDVDVPGPCFYQYLCWCDWSFLPLLMMLLSRIQSVTQNDVDVTDPHYQWKTCWRHWSLLYPLTMLMSMIPPTMGQLEEVILKPVVLVDTRYDVEVHNLFCQLRPNLCMSSVLPTWRNFDLLYPA